MFCRTFRSRSQRRTLQPRSLERRCSCERRRRTSNVFLIDFWIILTLWSDMVRPNDDVGDRTFFDWFSVHFGSIFSSFLVFFSCFFVTCSKRRFCIDFWLILAPFWDHSGIIFSTFSTLFSRKKQKRQNVEKSTHANHWLTHFWVRGPTVGVGG